MASGIFGNGDMTDMIGSLSVLNLVVTVPLFLVPCIVLLRRSKLDEIVEMREGEIIIPSEREGENIATVSLVLGICSRIWSGRSAWCNLFEKDKTTAERYSNRCIDHFNYRTDDRCTNDYCNHVSHAGFK